jgi:hypothetical protein
MDTPMPELHQDTGSTDVIPATPPARRRIAPFIAICEGSNILQSRKVPIFSLCED